jgi:hypothetical protein
MSTYGWYYTSRYSLLNDSSNAAVFDDIYTNLEATSNAIKGLSIAQSNWNYGSNTASWTSNSLSNYAPSNGQSNWNYGSNVATIASNAFFLSESNLIYASNSVSWLSNFASNYAPSNGQSNWDFASNVAAWTSNALQALSDSSESCCEFTSNMAVWTCNLVRQVIDPSTNSLSVGKTPNTWTISTPSTGSNFLNFVSPSGTIVRFQDVFTSSVLNFTGQHRCRYAGALHEHPSWMIGATVISSGKFQSVPSVSDALPLVTLSPGIPRDKRVFGVIASFDPYLSMNYSIGNIAFYNDALIEKSMSSDATPCVLINSTGEGMITVCDDFDIEIGDLLTTSSIPGMATKQEDDVVRAYTVAKATCSLDWKDATNTCFEHHQGSIRLHGIERRWARIPCVYLS